MGLLDILFGKAPKIFDDKGEVKHNHPKKKWDDWNKKYASSPEFNWKNHTGTKAGDNKKSSL